MTFKTMLISGLCALGVSPLASAGILSVTIQGVEQTGGDLYVSVQTEDQFLADDSVAMEVVQVPGTNQDSKTAAATSSTLFQKVSLRDTQIAVSATQSFTFGFELPDGDYSVSIWHDLNSDGVFDVDETGRPIEGWAMSNGDTLRQMPRFEDVKVELDGVATIVMETMQYAQ